MFSEPGVISYSLPLGPLPVELISFDAYLDDDDVVVEWLTASEENNDYFELQHSTNGLDFRPFTEIEGKGTTEKVQYYKYTHISPSRGNNYYRIKQVDLDGNYEIFDIVVVNIKVRDFYIVYPSQAVDLVTLEAPDGATSNTEISIYNTSGLLMKSAILMEGDYKIYFNVSDLPAGVYFIRFVNQDLDYTAKQFFKLEY